MVVMFITQALVTLFGFIFSRRARKLQYRDCLQQQAQLKEELLACQTSLKELRDSLHRAIGASHARGTELHGRIMGVSNRLLSLETLPKVAVQTPAKELPAPKTVWDHISQDDSDSN